MDRAFKDYLNWSYQHQELLAAVNKEVEATEPSDLEDLHTSIQGALNDIPRFIHPSASVDDTAQILGNVIIEAGAQVLSNVIVSGPAYIGKDAVVGNFSLLRIKCFLAQESLVGNHCYCNEVTVSRSARVAHFVNFSRSILAFNSAISAFVLTATAKADNSTIERKSGAKPIDKIGATIGANTFIAPHVTLSPGINVGDHCFVGSYTILNDDLPPGSFVEVERSIKIRQNFVKLPKRKKMARFQNGETTSIDRMYSGILLVLNDGKLILQRRDTSPSTFNPGKISTFGGRRLAGEPALEGAIRELKEETGLDAHVSELRFLTDVVFTRNDGSRTLCSIYLLQSIMADDIVLMEGEKIEILSALEAIEQPDLTDLCKTVLAEYLKLGISS